ncbi:MAG: hypothetical protein CSA49_04625 [Gammaproteobacteria bacterium]|nr:MAG: hypothetical protein CSA49_04625 [Gammaproteobacteria bacterium]
MSGYSSLGIGQQSNKERDGSNELFDNAFEIMSDDREEVKMVSSNKRKRSSGDYLRKIERLKEEKLLRDHLADYDWDD